MQDVEQAEHDRQDTGGKESEKIHGWLASVSARSLR
jgi:hypothetical protein